MLSPLLTPDLNTTVFDPALEWFQGPPFARSVNTQAALGFVHCTVGRAHKILAGIIKKCALQPVKLDRHMSAAVQVGMGPALKLHDEG
jgi:hypothetical protein